MAALPKDYGDLSPYEIARLQNIQANKQKLVELGLSAVVPKKPAKKQLSPDEVAEKARLKRKKQTLAKKERAKRQKLLAAPSTGRRRSSRLAGVAVQEKQARSSGEEEEEGKDDAIHYDRMPVEAHHLDDFEFEVYTAVRTWRLHRKRELGTFVLSFVHAVDFVLTYATSSFPSPPQTLNRTKFAKIGPFASLYAVAETMQTLLAHPLRHAQKTYCSAGVLAPAKRMGMALK